MLSLVSTFLYAVLFDRACSSTFPDFTDLFYCIAKVSWLLLFSDMYFVSSLLLAGTEEATDRRLTTRELVDECKTFFFGGHKTTPLALSWTLLMLAAHPDWQDAFAGSDWHGPLNGSCYSGRPGTVRPTPCHAREEIWTRRVARHG
uniref:Uncharacterized protein n=1 Tax=Zea mays TaxID=4577 RepID=B6T9T1_MAIZE|nr:hypothetical protein [Zea mays]